MRFNELQLIITKKKKINKKILKKIILLKSEHYQFSIESQKKWFYENIKSNDLHILIFLKKDLIGYNVLRDISIKTQKKKAKYILFDTLIVKKNFRGNGYSRYIMNASMEILSNFKKKSFLFCEKLMIPFYENYGWKTVNKNKALKIFNNSNYILNAKNKFTMIYK